MTITDLKWHKGPALGGGGTAGKDGFSAQWYDGTKLLIIVETNNGRDIGLVNVRADDERLELICANTDDHYDSWTLDQVSWWAIIDEKNLPPIGPHFNETPS